MNTPWVRVTRKDPCPICKHPDWCCLGERFINCMRVESAKPCTNGGWLHALGETPKPYRAPIKPQLSPQIDADTIMRGFSVMTSAEMIEQLAAGLGASGESLDLLGASWASGHNAWAFPMRDWRGTIIGIRLRDHTGKKWAVRGSRAGLFYAEGEARTCYVCEGPTDTAAGLSIGLCAIGRPSCLGCERETNQLIIRKGASQAVIISDNDGPGYRGALKLAESLSVPCVLWVPPAKDLREFVTLGGTKELIDSLTRSLLWTQPKKTDSSLTQMT